MQLEEEDDVEVDLAVPSARSLPKAVMPRSQGGVAIDEDSDEELDALPSSAAASARAEFARRVRAANADLRAPSPTSERLGRTGPSHDDTAALLIGEEQRVRVGFCRGGAAHSSAGGQHAYAFEDDVERKSGASLDLGEWPETDDKGRVYAWLAWTGHNPMPDYLALCIETFAHQASSHYRVRLVRPEDVRTLLDDVHPAYDALSLVHRADYLRCELLHRYGGLWVDVDTICMSNLTRPLHALRSYSAVLPETSLLYEAGMNAGLFRRKSSFTACWREGLRARLDARLLHLSEYRREFPTSLTEDALEWNEVLRDLLYPLVCAHQQQRTEQGDDDDDGGDGAAAGVLDIGRSLQAHLWLPSREQGFDPLKVGVGVRGDATVGSSSAGGYYTQEQEEEEVDVDLIVLTNNQYAGPLKTMPRSALLASDSQLAQMIRRANGWGAPR